jgi:hypothetical protein
MVGSWPCKVSSEIHINGWRDSEPVCEDKGKTTALEPEDRKDTKRARVVLSKGREVVGSGYSRVSGVAAKVTDKKENSGNHGRVKRVSKIEQHYMSRVNRVSQNSNTDWQADWVGRVTRISPSSSKDRQQIRLAGLAAWSRKQEVPVVSLTQKSRLRKIRPTQKAGLWKIQQTQKAGLWKIQQT